MITEQRDEEKTAFAPEIFDSEIYLVRMEGMLRHFSLAEPPAACRLLILLRDPDHEQCAPGDLDLLNKIADWKDLKLTRNEVTVVNLARQETSLVELNRNFHSANIIGFGIVPGEIGFHIEYMPNQLLQFRKVNFIFTASLKELTANDKLKQQFFREALRPMFR